MAEDLEALMREIGSYAVEPLEDVDVDQLLTDLTAGNADSLPYERSYASQQSSPLDFDFLQYAMPQQQPTPDMPTAADFDTFYDSQPQSATALTTVTTPTQTPVLQKSQMVQMNQASKNSQTSVPAHSTDPLPQAVAVTSALAEGPTVQTGQAHQSASQNFSVAPASHQYHYTLHQPTAPLRFVQQPFRSQGTVADYIPYQAPLMSPVAVSHQQQQLQQHRQLQQQPPQPQSHHQQSFATPIKPQAPQSSPSTIIVPDSATVIRTRSVHLPSSAASPTPASKASRSYTAGDAYGMPRMPSMPNMAPVKGTFMPTQFIPAYIPPPSPTTTTTASSKASTNAYSASSSATSALHKFQVMQPKHQHSYQPSEPTTSINSRILDYHRNTLTTRNQDGPFPKDMTFVDETQTKTIKKKKSQGKLGAKRSRSTKKESPNLPLSATAGV